MSLRPRLCEKEQKLLEDFLSSNYNLFHDFEYDIKIIPINESIKSQIEHYTKNWNELNCPRVDMIARNNEDKFCIFELKEEADFKTIAQLLAYVSFMQMTNQLITIPRLFIICRIMSPTNFLLAQLKGIDIIKL